jgi:hypothetical protein
MGKKGRASNVGGGFREKKHRTPPNRIGLMSPLRALS